MELHTTMLRAFTVLAAQLHFGRTAEQLGMTPARLTRLVQQLEAQVGCLLVQRNTHGCSLTEQGLRFLPGAQRIVAECDWLGLQFTTARTRAQGRFVIGATVGVLYEELPKYIRAARRKYPQVSCHMTALDESALRDSILDGSVNVGFTYFPDSDDLLSARRVSERRQCIAISPDHRLAGRTQVQIADLEGETLILPAERSAPRLHGWYRSFLDRGGARTVRCLEVEQIQAGLGLCAAGEGVCVLPEHLCQLRAGDVAYALLDDAPCSALWAVWRSDSPTRHVAQFLAAWG